MAYSDPFATRQKNASPQQEEEARSAAAIVRRARKDSYIPYQDAHFFNGEYDSPHGSSGSYDGRWDRYPEYRTTTETIRRRKYGSSQAGRAPDGAGMNSDGNRVETTNGVAENGRSEYERDFARDTDREFERDSRRDYYDEDDRRGRSRRGRRSRSRSDSRSRSRSRTRSRSRSTSRPPPYRPPQVAPKDDPTRPPEKYSILKAAKSAAMAGGVEAVRCRMEPGAWNGQKAQRVAIAAAVGVAIGSLRNGRLQSSSKKPYAEAAMTGFYAIDFLKRVARHTEFNKDSVQEQRLWREDAARKRRDERETPGLQERSRSRDRGRSRADDHKSHDGRR